MTVLLFAGLRDLAGANSVTVDLPDGSSVAALQRRLLSTYPNLSSLASRSRIAVNHEFADGDRIVLEGDEIALIPPVSGG